MHTGATVLLRCDALESGGLGHFSRCIALIQALQRSGYPRAHLSGRVESTLARAMAVGADVTMHPPMNSTQSLIRLASDIGASLVHVDDYGPWAGLRDVGRRAGIVTSTATDAMFGRRDADVIIDGSPTALRAFDDLYADADVALGPRYLALRDIFHEGWRPYPSEHPRTGLRVLVMMGGTDARGWAARVASAVHAVARVALVGVVALPAGFDAMRLQAGIVRVEPSPDLRRVVEGWDLVVTAAGTTVWELSALGVPMALVGVAENQRDHYATFVETRSAVGLGFVPGDEDVEALDVSQLERLAGGESISPAPLTDGWGASRVVDVWEAVLRDRASQPGVRAVRAEPRHAGRLFAWRNHPSTRAASRSTGRITWADHVNWLDATLSREDRLLLVMYDGAEAVGTVRFDEVHPLRWEASLAVAPAVRGLGYGKTVLRAGIAALLDAKAPREVVATIAKTNVPSQLVFTSAGFTPGPAAPWQEWTWLPPR